MKKRILVIDGNYHFHRCLGSLNMSDSVNNLETIQEKRNFTTALTSTLYNLWKTFEPFCQQMVFCVDNNSWRKKITPVKPYFIKDTEPIGYKENRKEKKQESNINYDNFNILIDEFTESLKSKMIVFDANGLEGDDELFLLSNKFKNNENIELLVFGNDGDLNQVVKDNCLIFRNIKSGDSPYGEYVISHNKYCKIFEKDKIDVKTQFLQPTFDTDYLKLFKVSLNGSFDVKRDLHTGIEIATPYKVALIKSITGDKKDNIFPIFRWLSTTGTKNFKVTEKHIDTALSNQGFKLTEKFCKEILEDPDLMMTLLLSLKIITKQQSVNLNSVISHLKHNLRLIVLSINNVPQEYLDNFEKIYVGYENEILNGTFDVTKVFSQSSIMKKDSATDLMQASLPDELNNL